MSDTVDYVKIAITYAKKASNPRNKGTFGLWIRLAAIRFLKDLNRAREPEPPFTFSEWHANDVCDFAEKLPHVEGVWDSPTIVLHDSHVFFLVQLFGFRNLEGGRRFTTALFAIARKNAKSTLAAIIGLYCQNCEGEIGPQVVTGATTGSQARIVFNVAKRMVEKTPDIQEAFNLRAYANSIASFGNGGFFKPINARASTQDGLNPSCVILDEIHAHQNHDLINVLKSAAGARANPLYLLLTTEGYANVGPWEEEREFAKKILTNVIEAEHYLVIYYAVDDKNEEYGIMFEDDDFDESAWIKANPLIEVNPILFREIKKEAIEAQAKPGKHAEFKIKRLNRQSSVAEGFINLTKWKACNRELDLVTLKQYPCYAGLDLSSTTDLASFRLVWDLEGVYYTYGWRWVPGIAVSERETRGLVPYKAWLDKGLLIPCGEEAMDYDVVIETMTKISQEYNIISVGYDSWNSSHVVSKCTEAGLNMVQFIQGPKSYHPAMQQLENRYLKGRFVHGNDPILNWNASNLVARKDVNLNNAPDKRRSKEKIDDMVALLMAIGQTITVGQDEAEHQVFFV
jgi:phage terminase large subunit-like protein